jgi:hypothetical protein
MMPLLAVAWADGNVSDAEREGVISEARSYGIAPDSAADRQLAAWLTDAHQRLSAKLRSTSLLGASWATPSVSLRRVTRSHRRPAARLVSAKCRHANRTFSTGSPMRSSAKESFRVGVDDGHLDGRAV